MRKTNLLALLAALLLSACKESGINQTGATVFPASTIDDSVAITMGDVMPFYDNGTMNIYHLRNITGSNSLFYHPIARLTTSDYIHYRDEGVVLDYEEDISSIDAALGTGSFIKDDSGLYHCFYTGHNGNAHDEDVQLPHVEAIRHATSPDQVNWTKDEEFMIFGYEDDFRDPYVYKDVESGKYCMLITTRHAGNAVIKRYQADSLSVNKDGWVADEGFFFMNDDGNYNMECPSYVEYNGKFYLAYSEQGENRVTHYRYRNANTGDWIRPSRDAIDASGFYAGRLEKAGEKLMAFAWCARLTGGNTGSFDWAGNLVSHELKQNENGELSPIMPQTYKDYFSHKVSYGEQEQYSFAGEKFEAHALNKKSTNVTRISMTLSNLGDDGDFGISFGLNNQYNNCLGDGMISFDLKEDRIICYNNVSSIVRYGSALTSIYYNFEENKEYSVNAIIDDEIISVYVNDEVALTCRLVNMENNFFTIYSNKAKVEIKGTEFYE